MAKTLPKTHDLEYWTKLYFRNGDITRKEYKALMAEAKNEKKRGETEEYTLDDFEDFVDQMREGPHFLDML